MHGSTRYLHHHATPHLARAGSSAMVLPPMAFRPALLPCTMRRAAEDAMNGARMAELATVSAAARARAEPHDKTLLCRDQNGGEQRTEGRRINGKARTEHIDDLHIHPFIFGSSYATICVSFVLSFFSLDLDLGRGKPTSRGELLVLR